MFFNTNFQIIVILLDFNYHYCITVANKDYYCLLLLLLLSL